MGKIAIKNRLIKGTLGVAVAMSVSLASAHAAQTLATLAGLEIKPSLGGSYEIVLNSDKNLNVKKHITSGNKIILDLTGAKASSSLNTVYNNVTGIDHVMFKPVSKDHLKIYLEGDNVSASKINIDTGALPKGLFNKKSTNSENVVVLNKPISSYSPVFEAEKEEMIIEENPFYENLLSSLAPGKIFNKSNLGWLVSVLILGLYLASALKKQKQANKVNIKISDDLKEKEIKLYSQINRKKDLIGKELGSNKPEIKPTISPKQAYGIKAYGGMSKSASAFTQDNRVSQLINTPKVPPINHKEFLGNPRLRKKATATAPKTGFATNKKDIKEAQVRIDNVKFLESMARIYEKSGRVDLANGLQQNILRARTKKI